MNTRLVFHLLVFGTFSCANNSNKKNQDRIIQGYPDDNQLTMQVSTCPMEDTLEALGLVKINSINDRIKEDLRYTVKDNFMGFQLYDCLDEAFLQLEAANMLDSAYKVLNKLRPGYSFLIWDAVRPKSIQQMMWDSLKMPFEEKVKYVSNPKNHSLHNYGCAIDLTLLDSFGRVLDMGTEFDHFGIEANTDKDSINMANGKLTKAQIRNRWLLRKCMYKAGFSGIKSEWWHFNSCSREVAKKRYKLIE